MDALWACNHSTPLRHPQAGALQSISGRLCPCRPFEDAFAAQKEPSPEPTAAGRKRKLTTKGKSRYGGSLLLQGRLHPGEGRPQPGGG